MCARLELLLCVAIVACTLLPALARCDISTRPPPPCQSRAMEDFAYLLATQQDPAQCERGDADRRRLGDTVAE